MAAKRSMGFTLIELLVVVAIIGVLMALLIPAVQQIREAARRSQCSNNLYQMGMAVANYENQFEKYPSGAKFGQGAGWHAYIMPFIEQSNIYDDLFLRESGPASHNHWTNAGLYPGNRVAIQQTFSVFKCPSDPIPPTMNSHLSFGTYLMPNRVTCSYVACAAGYYVPDGGAPVQGRYAYIDWNPNVTYPDKAQTEANRNGILVPWEHVVPTEVRVDDVIDGQASTVMIGEAVFDAAFLGSDADHWAVGSYDLDRGETFETPPFPGQTIDESEFFASTINPINYYHSYPGDIYSAPALQQELISYSFGSWHAGGSVHFVYADGHTKFIPMEIDPIVRQAIGGRNDRVENVAF